MNTGYKIENFAPNVSQKDVTKSLNDKIISAISKYSDNEITHIHNGVVISFRRGSSWFTKNLWKTKIWHSYNSPRQRVSFFLKSELSDTFLSYNKKEQWSLALNQINLTLPIGKFYCELTGKVMFEISEFFKDDDDIGEGMIEIWIDMSNKIIEEYYGKIKAF